LISGIYYLSPTTAQMNSTAQMTSTPSQPSKTELYFNKTITIEVREKLSFKNFKKYTMKKREKESDEDFHERCIDVWEFLCNKYLSGEIDCGDVTRDDDNEDCEAEIEEKIEEAEMIIHAKKTLKC
jgi:hypothetical protein